MKTNNKLLRPLLSVGLSLGIGLAVILPAAPTPVSAATSSTYVSKASEVINFGNRYLGTPYRFGASTSTTSYFDCSSFTKYTYKHVGVTLPRTSRDQAKVGKWVSKRNLRKGDLVFFSTRGSNGRIAHVGIYAGNGKILHTYGSPGVTYSYLNSKWWSSHYITARRVL